ncbi:MAG: DNA polymerase I [Acidimicrobiia bacterium]
MVTNLMLLDGNSLTYRAWFALPPDMATASGQVTNAVYGFTSMLLNLVRDHRPDGIVVAFDRPEPTFRHEAVAEYKAQRDETPALLVQQIGLVRQVLDVLDIPALDMVGFEADDIIATLATKAADAGQTVMVVTGDRDSYQLVRDPQIRVLYNRRGVSDYVLYDEAGIKERTGVAPLDYVDYAALRGDPSDNLDGVPGVGEKTAARLVNKYGDIAGIYDHLDEQTPKLRENLAASKELVERNFEMMTLRRDLEISVVPRTLAADRINPEALAQLIDFLEFHSLRNRINELLGAPAVNHTGHENASGALEANVVVLNDAETAVSALGTLATSENATAVQGAWNPSGSWRDWSWHTTAQAQPLRGLALTNGSRDLETNGTKTERSAVYWLPGELLSDENIKVALGELLGANGPGVIAHDAKALERALLGLGVAMPKLVVDTMLAAYLLDPGQSDYLLADLITRYAQLQLPTRSAVEEGRLDFDGNELENLSTDTASRALGVLALVAPLEHALEAQGLTKLYQEIEIPLVSVLARMEAVGVGVDRDALQALSNDLAASAATLAKTIQEDAGQTFNVNSTKQLRKVLFEDLGLTPQKKTKTGFSTDAASLEKLRGEHPIIEHLLEYREVEKLRSTYGEGLLAEVASDGRIHATFNQTVARTGRLSSDAPNLHNIPVRSELGRKFRAVFVPAAGFELLVADYNQIELRCIAHLAGDPGLINAFETGQDIHNATAARVFHVAADEVTHAQRDRAKMVSYGLAYGMEAYGLAQRLNIATGEAQEILDAYFAAFPSVHDYMERTVEEARQKGYTETLFGRRRQIPELASSNFRVRQAGERQAMNAGIQGLAADIFKVALVRLDAALRDLGSTSRIVLQVHDEVILEVEPKDRQQIADLVTTTMVDAFDLRVPLAVNLSFGNSWAEAKS